MGWKASLKRGVDALEKDEEGASFDSGLIGAALRTKHYEIAGYTATIEMAKALGLTDVVGFLTENVNEELTASKKILAVAQSILKNSAAEPEQEKKPKSAKEKYSDKKSKEDEKKAAPEVKRRVS